MKGLRLFCGLMLYTAATAHAADLKTSQGTKQVGGDITFNFETDMPEHGDSQTGFLIDISPNFGYFIANQLELTTAISTDYRFGKLNEGRKNVNFGVGLGFIYFMQSTGIVPFVGILTFVSFHFPEKGDEYQYLQFQLPFGVMFPLNSYVAIDFGLKLSFDLALNNDNPNYLKGAMGFLGVSSFF